MHDDWSVDVPSETQTSLAGISMHIEATCHRNVTHMSIDPLVTMDSQAVQVLLKLHYRELARRPKDLPDFADVEFRCHSQNGEDGILLYIFSLIGATNRKAAEICAGNGIECNAANLIVNHGWQGLLVDGDPDNVARGRAFYATHRRTCVAPPILVNEWITAENVDSIVAANGFTGPVDLLSIDIDGNDYWIWKALQCITPRVVVVEFNAACGPDRSVAMSYVPDYRIDLSKPPYRCGASLQAFVRLADAKGYRLVGVQALGFNAFFVQREVGEDLLPERSALECYRQTERLRVWTPRALDTTLSGEEAWEEV